MRCSLPVSSLVHFISQACTAFIFYKSFILVDVGDSGRHSDGGVLANSSFGQALEDCSLQFPEPCGLSG